MRKRSHALSVQPLSRCRKLGITCITAALLLASLCVASMGELFRASAAPTMQLVRLNVAQDAGMVRIEITADGSFQDAEIEQLSRGRETVVRIRGARSLLRASYAIDDPLARGVRIVAGERQGEPFVDVMIALGEGATLAQRKSFNRLFIGIATDFAALRRRKHTDGAAELARRETKTQSAPTASAITSAAEVKETTEKDESAAVNAFASAATAQESNAASLLATIEQPALRNRPLWMSLLGFQPHRPASVFSSHAAAQAGNVVGGALSSFSYIKMAIDAPGQPPSVWVPGTTTETEDLMGGRPLGAGILRPSFLLGASFSDNYFYRSQTGRDITVFSFIPRVEYEIPGVERALRMAYEAKLRRLSNGRWANGQQFDFDMRADLTDSLRLGVRNHFIRSPLDPREYDPAGEVYIVGDTFNRNDFAARLDFSFGQRSRLGLEGGSNIVRWSRSRIAGAPLFIDYDTVTAALSYERDISEETTALIAFTFNHTDTQAPLRPQFNGLSDNRRYALELGGRTQVSETSGFAFRAGFEYSDYRNAPSRNDFRGLIFDLLYRNDLTEKTNLQVAALRKTQVSAFNLEGGNARLVTTGGSARLETAWTEALKLALGLNYQRLAFPVAIVPTSTASGGVFVGNFAGEGRTDHLYGFEVGAGYRMSELLKAKLVYNFLRRDSTIPVLTFNTNRLALIFELGRRNDPRGRPF